MAYITIASYDFVQVLLQTAQKSSLNQSKIAAQGVKVKVGSSQFNKSTCSGKENMRGRTVFSHRSGSKASLPVVRVSDHKVTKLKSINKVGVTTIDSKVTISVFSYSVSYCCYYEWGFNQEFNINIVESFHST